MIIKQLVEFRTESLGGLLNGRTSDLGDSYLTGLPTNLGFNGGLFDFGPQSSHTVKVQYRSMVASSHGTSFVQCCESVSFWASLIRHNLNGSGFLINHQAKNVTLISAVL